MLKPLPIDEVLPAFLQALKKERAAVLLAPTGAGKTTRVPPALWRQQDSAEQQEYTGPKESTGQRDSAGPKDSTEQEEGVGPKESATPRERAGQIVVLEPRRVAARAAARRMAQEQEVTFGDDIGYHVRFDRQARHSTGILVVTEGIFLRKLQEDPFLEGIAAVLFDEFHERNLFSDLALALVRKVQQELRPELQIAVMSATLDPWPVSAYLGDCPMIQSKGKLYPVEIHYDDSPRSPSLPGNLSAGLAQRVSSQVRRALQQSEGDVLVFLPGVGEIHRCAQKIEEWAASEPLDLMSLYGDLSPQQQDRVLLPGTQRKVILATNVAETSLTIEGVRLVVDSGLARVLRYDPGCGLDRLELVRISRASAAQRAGRAGREAPGLCLRLWSPGEQEALRPTEEPEIRRIDLAASVLTLLAWGENDLTSFPWFEAPRPASLQQATLLLHQLEALDEDGLSPLGHQMASLPLHPRLARLLLESHQRSSLPQGALAAALLSERDPFRQQKSQTPNTAAMSPPLNILERLDLLLQHKKTRRPPPITGATRHLFAVSRQLAQLVEHTLPAASDRHKAQDGRKVPSLEEGDGLPRALLAAFPDRLARRREGDPSRAVMVGGRGVRLGGVPEEIDGDLFLCLDLDAGPRQERSEALVRLACPVEREWLPEKRLSCQQEVEFDPQRERVFAWRRWRYDDLLLEEQPDPQPDPQRVAETLAQAAAQNLEKALSLDNERLQRFLRRVRFLASALPEKQLPPFDEEHLLSLLPQLCWNKRSFDELRRLPLLRLLQQNLTYPQRQLLDEEAPETMEVPSGSRIRLTYQEEGPPILAVRIQEIFGLADTPRLAAGRVQVLLHLLAPNRRPQQVTQDLRSFWDNTYPEVRKELRQRYPKHAWPPNPWQASPEQRPQRKRR